MADLHNAGRANARALIDRGLVNSDSPWSFSAADGNALLGGEPGGDDNADLDWDRFSAQHLGREPGEDAQTKAAWKFPVAKIDGDGRVRVFRSGLRAAASRAGQTGDTAISEAASALLDRIDQRQSGRRTYPHVAQRLFNQPLAIAPDKLQAILHAVGPRLGVSAFDEMPAPTSHTEHLPVSDQGVVVIPIIGTLVHKAIGAAPPSGLLSYSEVIEAVQRADRDHAVKRIVLDIDSEGGEVAGLFEAAEAVAKVDKPVWAIVDEQACSAAYALACATDRIFVPATGIVGSIGVMAVHVDQSELDRETGLDFTFISSGTQKLDGNPHEPLSDGARARIEAEVARTAEMFFELVARHRGFAVATIRDMEAGIFTGEAAVAAGLADAVLSPLDAMARAGQAVRQRFRASSQSPRLWTDAVKNSGALMVQKPSCALLRPTRWSQAMADPTAGPALGNALDEAINDRIDPDAEESERDQRAAIVRELADAAGITPGTMNAVIRGTIQCPPRNELVSWAEILDIPQSRLINAAEQDGRNLEEVTDVSPTEETPESELPNSESKVVHSNVFAAAKGRAQGMAYATQVYELCALAGRSDLANSFIEREVPVASVRKQLLKERADDDPPVSTQHTPSQQSAAEMWKKVLARRGKLKQEA